MNIEHLKNKKILIVGYGVEGRATLQYLHTVVPSATVDVTDKKNGRGYLEHQDSYDVRIKSPGIRNGVVHAPYTTATNIFFANTKGITIGVTGTKGKSTTSSLIYAILKAAGHHVHLVGNIGRPMLSELGREQRGDDVYVCELSSYQLDDISYSPHIAVCINFFPEHMDYHGSVDAYWEAKKKIVAFSKKTDYFVYNPNFEKLKVLAKETTALPIPYISDLPFPKSDIPLLGEHNVENVRAAVTVAQLFHVPGSVMRSAILSFTPLPHRLQNVGTYRGITFYDDAISTTPESTICAIHAVDHIGTIFLGGQDRGYDFHTLAEAVYACRIRNVVLFPDSGKKIEKLLHAIAPNFFEILETSDMETAVKFAYGHTEKGSSCILSTASPSYSIWKNFEEKGDLFQHYVKVIGMKTI